MVIRPSRTQPDLFSDSPHEMAPVAKKPAIKAKSTCTLCMATYCTVQEVADRYKVFRSTVWRWVESEPHFPKPVKLTPGTTRWVVSDLVRYEKTQKAKSNATRHRKGGA